MLSQKISCQNTNQQMTLLVTKICLKPTGLIHYWEIVIRNWHSSHENIFFRKYERQAGQIK